MPSQRKQRKLVVIADDYGIGPNTSKGILELGQRGVVTGTVVLVTSPFANEAVQEWRQADRPMELGWHPNLTLDYPVLPAEKVPSLTGPEGKFWPLGAFLQRAFLGRINPEEVSAELRAQLERFIDMVGEPPTHVNSQHHVSNFEPVRSCLLEIVLEQQPIPYVRRLREPWSMVWKIGGARKKRAFLNFFGRITSRQLAARQVPGNDWLAGITDPPWVRDPEFFERWLRAIPGQVVELSCHPGYLDVTLLGRDCFPGDGLMERRADELVLLQRPEFFSAVEQAGFRIVTPAQLTGDYLRHAA